MNGKINYSLEAEQSVLGGLILSPDYFDEVASILTFNNFYIRQHQIIYKAINELCSKNIPLDILTLDRFLQEKKESQNAGGFAYLTELANNVPSTANIKTYAEIVLRDFKTRQLLSLGKNISYEAMQISSQEKLDKLIETTEKTLTDLSLNLEQEETNVDLTSVLDELIKDAESNASNKTGVTGVPSGLTELDKITTGYKNGDLILLAARPSMGKTALSLTIAYSALESTNKPVQYYSLEMPAKRILERILSIVSGISASSLQQPNNLGPHQWANLSNAITKITKDWEGRLLLDDSSYMTIQMLKTRVRRNVRKFGQPSLIIVDYLQLISSTDNKQNRNLEIDAISRALKQLAKETNCPVIALSQLNRYLEQRADKRPMNSDLRDSGALEQDADLIQFIFREEVYNKTAENRGIAEIILGKNRNGACGSVLTKFRGECSLFSDLKDNSSSFGSTHYR